MSVDKTTVAKIARLARIKVPDDRLQLLAEELNSILSWIDDLNEVETNHVEPSCECYGPCPATAG